MSTTTPNFRTSRESLIAIPLPKETKSYSPVPNQIIIDTCMEQFDKAGIKVISEMYSSARNGMQANGFYTLEGGDAEMNFRLQWQNSYNKSLPLGCGMGTNVIVCGNGMVIGDMGRFKRKHTGDVLNEFVESIKQYIGEADVLFKRMKHDRERMKEITMTKRACAELVGRMFIEDEIITATQVGIIKRELQNPSYNYGTDKAILANGGTLWDTYNAATVSFKEDHPQNNMGRHVDLHKFVVKNYEKEFA